jgi:hypothetical protein
VGEKNSVNYGLPPVPFSAGQSRIFIKCPANRRNVPQFLYFVLNLPKMSKMQFLAILIMNQVLKTTKKGVITPLTLNDVFLKKKKINTVRPGGKVNKIFWIG